MLTASVSSVVEFPGAGLSRLKTINQSWMVQLRSLRLLQRLDEPPSILIHKRTVYATWQRCLVVLPSRYLRENEVFFQQCFILFRHKVQDFWFRIYLKYFLFDLNQFSWHSSRNNATFAWNLDVQFFTAIHSKQIHTVFP